MSREKVRQDGHPEWGGISVLFYPGDQERIEEFFRRNRQAKKGVLFRDAIIEKLDREERIERIRSGETETQYTGQITEQMAEDAR